VSSCVVVGEEQQARPTDEARGRQGGSAGNEPWLLIEISMDHGPSYDSSRARLRTVFARPNCEALDPFSVRCPTPGGHRVRRADDRHGKCFELHAARIGVALALGHAHASRRRILELLHPFTAGVRARRRRLGHKRRRLGRRRLGRKRLGRRLYRSLSRTRTSRNAGTAGSSSARQASIRTPGSSAPQRAARCVHR
jgi:hypothetical protein